MKSRTRLAMVIGALLLVRVASADKPMSCDVVPDGECPNDPDAAVAACCDRNSSKNDGEYAGCIAHATNTLRKAGCLDKPANPNPQVRPTRKPVACASLLPGGLCPSNVGAALAGCCECDDSRNHGTYVTCVASAVNALRKAGCLDDKARRTLKRCAARSTCGLPGFVTCCRTKPGACINGFCARAKPPVACTTDGDCPAIPHCSIKQDVAACTAVAGTAGTFVSCCDACG